MKFFVLTSSVHKKKEIEKYFIDAGIKIKWITDKKEVSEESEYFLIREQTQLLNESGNFCTLQKVEKCIHTSVVYIEIKENDSLTNKEYQGSVTGFIFPNLKNKPGKEIYDWDDIFVSKNSHLSYQQMKEKGIKNSARDIAFSLMTDDFKTLFLLKQQMNLNFNYIEGNEIVSFKPVIYDLLKNNKIYSIAYKNEFFKPILNKVLNNGLFIRRATNRAQKNYWLPGVNAGIPLTPKKDSIHELTFMFHDIMHFLFPDFILNGNTPTDKKIYIISRMMSEAFTIIMADFLFIDVLKKSGIEYDFEKRKIYPLFKNLNIDVSLSSLSKIKEVLYKNALFVLMGNEKELKNLVNDDINFEKYKEKYQPFFTEDYVWTNNNANHFMGYADVNEKWYEYVLSNGLNHLKTTKQFSNLSSSTKEIFDQIFEVFFSTIENAISENTQYNKVLSYKNAYMNYLSGQMMIFYNYSAHYNDLFKSSIEKEIEYLHKADKYEDVLFLCEKINNIYAMYLDTLKEDKLINSYKVEQYKNIYPMFDPFYVFYDKKEQRKFNDVFKDILSD